jgi:hypothetical protein
VLPPQPRPELTNKVAVASMDGAAIFNEDMFVAAQKKHNV